MPKPTFYRLPQEKQNALLNAAKEEFKNHVLKDASINRIIKNANISRGGFYLYFENISDLYFYLLDEFKDEGVKRLITLLEEHHGDLVESFLSLFSFIASYCLDENRVRFFKNVFLNMTLQWEKELFREEQFQTPRKEEDKKAILNLIDKKNLLFKKEEDLFDIIGIFFTLLLEDLLPIIVFNQSIHEAKTRFTRHILYFKYGIYQKRKED